MSSYEVYIFCLCFIVFLIFTVLFSYMITMITSMKIKLIKSGLEDEEIKQEKTEQVLRNRCAVLAVKIFDLVVCALIVVAFLFSAYVGTQESKIAGTTPSLRVVKSGSMSKQHESNAYLFENELNNQIQVFDLILTRPMPSEDDIKLYDVIVYEKDERYIVHRVVEIEERNEYHPDSRHFKLQGDANGAPDKYPILYSQMRGIYQNERVPFVGSFIMFLQSPAGWLCLILVLFALIATPIVEKKLTTVVDERWTMIQPTEIKKPQLLGNKQEDVSAIEQKFESE